MRPYTICPLSGKMKVYIFCYYVQQTKLFCQIVIKISKYLQFLKSVTALHKSALGCGPHF